MFETIYLIYKKINYIYLKTFYKMKFKFAY